MAATAPPTTVTLTIDGQEVTVPRGTLVIEAARQIGIEIPVFCYHPKLSLVGACRMCSCEIQMPPPPGQQPRPPGILTACTTQVAPGMVVNTLGPQSTKHREAVIEFLLINHPLDCPVCDAGGECPLQDNSHAWGPKESRFEEHKRLARKGAPLSPLVVLDQERCIVCYRCTRFMAEVPGQAELDFFSRGFSSQLRTIDDQPMKSHFQGNIIDLCPCGALTSETYRFKARPHDLDHADSVCAQCPVGCNMIIDSRSNEVVRVRPRQNEAVNEIWLCDKGRFGQYYFSSKERIAQPHVRQDDQLRPASWSEAIGSAAVALQGVKGLRGPGHRRDRRAQPDQRGLLRPGPLRQRGARDPQRRPPHRGAPHGGRIPWRSTAWMPLTAPLWTPRAPGRSCSWARTSTSRCRSSGRASARGSRTAPS